MSKNKGKGGKNRRRGKNENDNVKRELTFKEEDQGQSQNPYPSIQPWTTATAPCETSAGSDDPPGSHGPLDSGDVRARVVFENVGNHKTAFFYELNEDGSVDLHVKDPSTTQGQRLDMSHCLPDIVRRPGSLSAAEQNTVDMHELEGGGMGCFWRHQETRHMSCQFMNEVDTLSEHKDMERIQELLIDHGRSQALDENNTGTIVNLSISVEQGKGNIQPHVHLWPAKPKGKERPLGSDPVTAELVKLVASVTTNLINLAIPSELRETLESQYIVDVSLCAGYENNIYTAIMQANVSLIGEPLGKAIGAGGTLHIDRNDDRARFNIVLFLSHLPEGWCPGKFVLTNDRTYCITAPYTALVSSGAMPHLPIGPSKYEEGSIRHVKAGPIPPPSTSPDFRRISVVPYPHEQAMKPDLKKIKPVMLEPGSLVVYGTQRNMHEFWARKSAREEQLSAAEGARPVSPNALDRIVREHSWVEEGVSHEPRPELIAKTLLGPAASDDAFMVRKDFITSHVFCGKTYHGRREGQIILVDMAGDPLPERKAEKVDAFEDPRDAKDAGADAKRSRQNKRQKLKRQKLKRQKLKRQKQA